MPINCRLLYIYLSIPLGLSGLPFPSASGFLYTCMHYPSDPSGTRAHYCPSAKSVFEVFGAHGLSLFFRGVQLPFERTASAKHAHRHTITQNTGRFLSCKNSQANYSQRSRHHRCTYTFAINRLTLFIQKLLFPSCCFDVVARR